MGGCPSTEEAPRHSSDGAVVSRRELWAPTLPGGACNHKLLDELLLGERRFVADMHVRESRRGRRVRADDTAYGELAGV